MTLPEQGLEVARILGQQLVAEVVCEAPAALAEGPHDLSAKSRYEDITGPGIVFPPHHLPQDRCHHIQLSM
jgi:hypothetical protein